MAKNINKPVFGKMNYLIMLGGLVLLILGFFIMTQDDEPYGFGAMGITVGPIIVILGFVAQFFAIMYKPKDLQKDKAGKKEEK